MAWSDEEVDAMMYSYWTPIFSILKVPSHGLSVTIFLIGFLDTWE
jgi:hypothetical protein